MLSLLMSPFFLIRLIRVARFLRGLCGAFRRKSGVQCLKVTQRDPEWFRVIIDRNDVEALFCFGKENVPGAYPFHGDCSGWRSTYQIITTITVIVHIYTPCRRACSLTLIKLLSDRVSATQA